MKRDIEKVLKEFMEWYDQPKTTVLHKEGFKNFVNEFQALIASERREAVKDFVKKIPNTLANNNVSGTPNPLSSMDRITIQDLMIILKVELQKGKADD